MRANRNIPYPLQVMDTPDVVHVVVGEDDSFERPPSLILPRDPLPKTLKFFRSSTPRVNQGQLFTPQNHPIRVGRWGKGWGLHGENVYPG